MSKCEDCNIWFRALPPDQDKGMCFSLESNQGVTLATHECQSGFRPKVVASTDTEAEGGKE